MDFKCKVNSPECGELFSSECDIFEHFKKIHNLKESNDEFPCPVNNDCKEQYLQARGAKNHAKKCILTWYVLFEAIVVTIIHKNSF